MRKIKMMLEYQCYPIWVYNEAGEIICNDMIEELEDVAGIGELLDDIQDTYDKLFINDEVQFEYRGFKDDEEKGVFLHKIERAIQLIEEAVGDKYILENKVVL